MSALESVSNQVENIPGFGLASTVYESYAPDTFKTRDPFYVKVDGNEVRRKAPAECNERQKRAWKAVIKMAWKYDRNFCCGCVGVDIGLGIIPIINFLPVIGPILAYTLQGSLIRKGSEVGLPATVQTKMAANCATDFVISLCPLLGVLFSWMYGCATRNAALFDAWLEASAGKAPGTRTTKESAGFRNPTIGDAFRAPMQNSQSHQPQQRSLTQQSAPRSAPRSDHSHHPRAQRSAQPQNSRQVAPQALQFQQPPQQASQASPYQQVPRASQGLSNRPDTVDL